MCTPALDSQHPLRKTSGRSASSMAMLGAQDPNLSRSRNLACIELTPAQTSAENRNFARPATLMRLVGRGLFGHIARKSGGCLPESVSRPKPTLVERCNSCVRRVAWFKKTCCWPLAAVTSVASSRGIRFPASALSKCWLNRCRSIR